MDLTRREFMKYSTASGLAVFGGLKGLFNSADKAYREYVNYVVPQSLDPSDFVEIDMNGNYIVTPLLHSADSNGYETYGPGTKISDDVISRESFLDGAQVKVGVISDGKDSKILFFADDAFVRKYMSDAGHNPQPAVSDSNIQLLYSGTEFEVLPGEFQELDGFPGLNYLLVDFDPDNPAPMGLRTPDNLYTWLVRTA